VNRLTIEINQNTHDCNDFKVESRGMLVCSYCGLEMQNDLVYETDMRLKGKHYASHDSESSNGLSTLFTMPGSRLPPEVRKYAVDNDYRTHLRLIAVLSEVCSFLSLNKQVSERAAYIARKIIRNRNKIMRCNIMVAIATGLYIALRESKFAFTPASMINVFAVLGHKVCLSQILSAISHYSRAVNYNRERKSGATIYLERVANSIKFRSDFNAKKYQVSFVALLDAIKKEYMKVRMDHVKKNGKITCGHALLVCRAIMRVELALNREMRVTGKKATKTFTIPYLLQIVNPKSMLISR
jgi:transcription initiation factor TFIIIB Brf1 subunit/transcription initiation factor TFIIB